MGTQTGRVLLVVGLVVAGAGLLLMAGDALGLGRLPGDLSWRRGNVRVFAPIATCLLLSIVASIVFSLISRR